MRQLYLIWAWVFYFMTTVTAADNEKHTDDSSNSFSITRIITNSNLGSLFSINTKSTTSKTSSSSSLHPITSTTVPDSFTTEDPEDKSLFKFMFTLNSYYYDMPVLVGSQPMDLRLDVLQNGVWVMNGNDVMNCLYLQTWWSSESSVHSDEISHLPASITTASEYTATVCADAGAFTTDDAIIESLPDSKEPNMENLDPFRIPYLNTINATGVVLTSNLTVFNANNQSIEISDFTFVDVNLSNVFVGGFGLAGNYLNRNGILDSLADEDIIGSNGYSLHFGSFSDTGVEFAQVMPGTIDQKYYMGNLYSYKMLGNSGNRFSGNGLNFENELVKNMMIPSTQLTGLDLENQDTGETTGLKSGSNPMPVIFDSRTIFNLIPLDVIVNIAMQTNAFYSEQVNRWIVECDTIRNSNAAINFSFGNLTIGVPIEDFLLDASTSGENLTFTSGKPACFLKFLPASDGFSTLGLSFLKSIYLAVDNEGGNIGMARANKAIHLKQSDYFPLNQHVHPYNESEASSNATDVKSIDSIRYNHIPFATTWNDSASGSLTFSPYGSAHNTLTVPARFSGAFITSGEVFLTHSFHNAGTQTIPGFATAAAEDGSDDDSDDDDSSVAGCNFNILGIPTSGKSNNWLLIMVMIIPLLAVSL